MKSPQDVDRAGLASQASLATVVYWHGEVSRLVAKLKHARAELAASEDAHQTNEIARSATNAPGE
jgi:hypothetical protein